MEIDIIPEYIKTIFPGLSYKIMVEDASIIQSSVFIGFTYPHGEMSGDKTSVLVKTYDGLDYFYWIIPTVINKDISVIIDSNNEKNYYLISDPIKINNEVGEILKQDIYSNLSKGNIFQSIRFHDGSNFGLLNIYQDKASLILSQGSPIDFPIDGTMMHQYRITGKENDIKVYIDNQLAIDASSLFTAKTTEKQLEFGASSDCTVGSLAEWDYFRYTTKGAFSPKYSVPPTVDEVFSFPNREISTLKKYNDNLYLSVDSKDKNQSSELYKYDTKDLKLPVETTPITKSYVSSVIIDKNRSGNIFGTSGKFVGTNKGLQYVIGSKVLPFDSATYMDEEPDSAVWTLEQNCEEDCSIVISDVLSIDLTEESGLVQWKYTQDDLNYGWGKNADNASGWTVETKVKVVNDGSSGAVTASIINIISSNCKAAENDGVPEDDGLNAPGIYINDGKYQEVIQFFQSGIRLKYAGIFAAHDLSDQFYSIRILGRLNGIAVYLKGDSDQTWTRLIFDPNAFSIPVGNPNDMELPHAVSDSIGTQHVVWQQAEGDTVGIYYAQFKNKVVLEGSGLVPSDINNQAVRLSSADFSNIDSKNEIIIYHSIGAKRYGIASVVDRDTLILNITDDMSEMASSSFSVISNDREWGKTYKVTNSAFDCLNPRIAYSNSKLYVSYETIEYGHSDIYCRVGDVLRSGVQWKQTQRVTNSSRDSKSADIAINGDDIAIVCESSNSDGYIINCYKLSAVSFGTVDPISYNVLGGIYSRELKSPKITASSNSSIFIIVYLNHNTDNVSIITQIISTNATPESSFAAYNFGTNIPGDSNSLSLFSFMDLNDYNCTALAWEQIVDDHSEINLAILRGNEWLPYGSDTITENEDLTDYSGAYVVTSSCGDSKNPCISQFGNFIVVGFESDRVRSGYFDPYYLYAQIGETGLSDIISSRTLGLDVHITSSVGEARNIILSNGINDICAFWETQDENGISKVVGVSTDLEENSNLNIVAYFPFNDLTSIQQSSDTELYNVIRTVGEDGLLEVRQNAVSTSKAASSVDSDFGSSLFREGDEKALDIDGSGKYFSVPAELIGKSGAIDLRIRPHFDSSAISSEKIFFGNGGTEFAGDVDGIEANTMYFGIAADTPSPGRSLKFRLVDSSLVVHETKVYGNLLEIWEQDDDVHLRAVWDSNPIGVATINSICFDLDLPNIDSGSPTPNIGYACGNQGVIFRTEDGGETWVKQTTGITYDLYSIFYSSESNCIIACGEFGTILRCSSTSSSTWEVITLTEPTTSDFKCIAFAPPTIETDRELVTVGNDGIIYSSLDAGLTWTKNTFEEETTKNFNTVMTISHLNLSYELFTGFIAAGDDGVVYRKEAGTTEWELLDIGFDFSATTSAGTVKLGNTLSITIQTEDYAINQINPEIHAFSDLGFIEVVGSTGAQRGINITTSGIINSWGIVIIEDGDFFDIAFTGPGSGGIEIVSQALHQSYGTGTSSLITCDPEGVNGLTILCYVTDSGSGYSDNISINFPENYSFHIPALDGTEFEGCHTFADDGVSAELTFQLGYRIPAGIYEIEIYRGTSCSGTPDKVVLGDVVNNYNALNYIGGNDGSLIVTDNGGDSWYSFSGYVIYSEVLTSIRAISIDSEDTVYFAIDGKLFSNSSGHFRPIDIFPNRTTYISAPEEDVVFVSGSSGSIMKSEDGGNTQTYSTFQSKNLNIFINGKEAPNQIRTNDAPFLWEPTYDLVFGGKSNYSNCIMDELVIYSSPPPRDSAISKYEVRSLKVNPIFASGSAITKRIEWGNITPFAKGNTLWKEFKMFFCGAKEPVQVFCWDTRIGLGSNIVNDMTIDEQNKLWLATDNGITSLDIATLNSVLDRWLNGVPETLEPEYIKNYNNLPTLFTNEPIISISSSKVGLVASSKTTLMQFIAPETTSPTETTEPSWQYIDSTNDGVKVIRAYDNAVFYGTENGVYITRFDTDPPSTIKLDVTSGLSSNTVNDIAQDSFGTIWIATDRGLVSYFKGSLSVYDSKTGLIGSNVSSIFIDKDDNKILGTNFGIAILKNNKFSLIPPSSGIGSAKLLDGTCDSLNNYWFATADGLLEVNKDCAKHTLIDVSDGLVGDSRIIDYEKYKLNGVEFSVSECSKPTVFVYVNNEAVNSGFTVNYDAPWISFTNPLDSSDEVKAVVNYSLKKVEGVFDKVPMKIGTTKGNFFVYKKGVPDGSYVLGGARSLGAVGDNIKQYSVFIQENTEYEMTLTVESPVDADVDLFSSTELDSNFYIDDTDIKVTSLPSGFGDYSRIVLKNANKTSSSNDYLQFSVSTSSPGSTFFIYIAYDASATTIPNWLRDFEQVYEVKKISQMAVFTDGSEKEQLFIGTKGTNGCVYSVLDEPFTCDISAKIAVDSNPPEGCVTVASMNSATSVTFDISATDEVTGVSEMQISANSDFEEADGTASPWLPYQTKYNYQFPEASVSPTVDLVSIENGIGSCMIVYGGKILIGVSESEDYQDHASIYELNRNTGELSLLVDTEQKTINCLAEHAGNLIIGTGGSGRVYKWNQADGLIPFSSTVGTQITALGVFAGDLYVGSYPEGEIYIYRSDDDSFELFLNTDDTKITGFSVYKSILYISTENETVIETPTVDDYIRTTNTDGHYHSINVAADGLISDITGNTETADGHIHAIVDGIVQPYTDGHTHIINGIKSGKIYTYDKVSGQKRIVHVDSDYSVSSIATTSTNEQFAGTYPHGKILRNVSDVFVKSFQTPKNKVRRLKLLSDNSFIALVDEDIYTYSTSGWSYKASTSIISQDVLADSVPGELIILQEETVQQTANSPAKTTNLCAYIRFKDVAGNITDVKKGTTFVQACYNPCVTSTTPGNTGSGTSLGLTAHRIFEINGAGQVVLSLGGNDRSPFPFYSANKVEEEVATYYSQYFNGTTRLVRWETIGWDETIPSGSEITMSIRTAATQEELAEAIWSEEFTDSDPNDISGFIGQYLQFRATLRVTEQGSSSPSLNTVSIQMRTSDAVHFYTTNFVLPESIKSAILTYNGCINPPSTDIVFGINGQDSTDFGDYYVIPVNKTFDLPPEHQTTNLRVGIKLISSATEVPVVDEFALLFSLANDALIKLNLVDMPTDVVAPISTYSTTTTIFTTKDQGHQHSVTYDSSIVEVENINVNTSVNAGHFHEIRDGVVSIAAGHTHTITLD